MQSRYLSSARVVSAILKPASLLVRRTSLAAAAFVALLGLGASVARAELIYVSLSDSTIVSYDVSLGSAAAVQASRSVFASGSSLNAPEEMVFDSEGNMYTTNRNGNTISKITPTGVVTTFASGAPSLLNKPIGLAIDSFNNLYVANENGGSITKITQAGVASTFASNIGSYGLTADTAGNIYAGVGSVIKKIDQFGTVTTFATTDVNSARGLRFDAAGNLFVANFGNHTIAKYTADGTGSQFVNLGGYGPNDVAFDSLGNMYVAANGSREVWKYNASGVFQFKWNMGGPRSQHLLAQFDVVPAPGAIALLGLAGLAGRRRR
jgi:hypothetical protein